MQNFRATIAFILKLLPTTTVAFRLQSRLFWQNSSDVDRVCAKPGSANVKSIHLQIKVLDYAHLSANFR